MRNIFTASKKELKKNEFYYVPLEKSSEIDSQYSNFKLFSLDVKSHGTNRK